MLLRTAKSCGPDAPTLASSSRSCVGPTGLRQNLSADDGGKRARSPGRARRKPLKPLRAGMPGDSGVLVVTRVRSTTTSAHEAAGALGIRRSPRHLWAEDLSTPRALRVAGANACLELGSRHSPMCKCTSWMRHLAQARNPYSLSWLWIPGSRFARPGMTVGTLSVSYKHLTLPTILLV
jgi:hypothetical protein